MNTSQPSSDSEDRSSSTVPLVFLLGPPGSGKTTAGGEACQRLGLRFLDLTPPAEEAGQVEEGWEAAALQQAITDRSADLIAIPWTIIGDRQVLKQLRQAGHLLGIWAHPLEMQARSGRSEPLFEPVKGLKIKGGFGYRGTRCREFRNLERACEGVLMAIEAPFEEVVEELTEILEDLAEEASGDPAEREGIDHWVEELIEDGGSRKAAKILVDAMARFTLHLREKGASPRALSGVYSDLQAAAYLVFEYDSPKPSKVLDHFLHSAPNTSEFKQKFSDSPRQMKRYKRHLEAFGKFLLDTGLVKDD